MRWLRFMARGGLSAGLFFLAGSSLTQAVDQDLPRIDLIEKFGANQVTIHFTTAAGKVYSLQSRDMAAKPGEEWTTLFTLPVFPFVNHYVLADWATNASRVYRLASSL